MHKLFILCALILAMQGLAFGQSSFPDPGQPGHVNFILTTNYSYKPDTNSIIPVAITSDNAALDFYSLRALITSDSLPEFVSMYVKVGSVKGGQDIAVNMFQYDTYTGLPAGMSYARNGNEIFLCLGIFKNPLPDLYYGELVFVDKSGNRSQSLFFPPN